MPGCASWHNRCNRAVVDLMSVGLNEVKPNNLETNVGLRELSPTYL